jgi:hypothetical protein
LCVLYGLIMKHKIITHSQTVHLHAYIRNCVLFVTAATNISKIENCRKLVILKWSNLITDRVQDFNKNRTRWHVHPNDGSARATEQIQIEIYIIYPILPHKLVLKLDSHSRLTFLAESRQCTDQTKNTSKLHCEYYVYLYGWSISLR